MKKINRSAENNLAKKALNNGQEEQLDFLYDVYFSFGEYQGAKNYAKSFSRKNFLRGLKIHLDSHPEEKIETITMAYLKYFLKERKKASESIKAWKHNYEVAEKTLSGKI
jgi:hypothetical protein